MNIARLLYLKGSTRPEIFKERKSELGKSSPTYVTVKTGFKLGYTRTQERYHYRKEWSPNPCHYVSRQTFYIK